MVVNGLLYPQLGGENHKINMTISEKDSINTIT